MTSKERKRLNRILRECNHGKDDMEIYTATLEDPDICTCHFDKIAEIVDTMLTDDLYD